MQNERDVFDRAACLMPPGAYVVLHAAEWRWSTTRTRRPWRCSILAVARSQPVLDAAGLTPACSAARRRHDAVGRVTKEFASATGLAPDTRVVRGCGDEMAATLGAGVFAAGEVCDVAGTAEPVCAVSTAPREDRTMLVECHPHADPDSWLLENPGFVSAATCAGGATIGARESHTTSAACGRCGAGREGLVFFPTCRRDGARVERRSGASTPQLAHSKSTTRALLKAARSPA
jgi:sugar (pentulose or hexulose) kinase